MTGITVGQRRLSPTQTRYFHVGGFVAEQVAHFQFLTRYFPPDRSRTVVDMGGGVGHFAVRLQETTGLSVRVIDSDQQSLQVCRRTHGDAAQAVRGDALAPMVEGDEGVVCFNLILHHLVGDNETSTRELQKRALSVWLNHADYLFVNEYVYESLFGNVSGRLIYEVTKSKALSTIARAVSKFLPSLHANTFFVGVRFRGHEEWISLFREAGWEVVSKTYGAPNKVSVPRLVLLFLRAIRRDSYLLVRR